MGSLGLIEPPRGVSRHRGLPAPHRPRSTPSCCLGHRVWMLLPRVPGDPLHILMWGPEQPGNTAPHPCTARAWPPQPRGVSGDPNSCAASRHIAHPPPGMGIGKSSVAPCVPGHPRPAVLVGECAAAWLVAPCDAHGAGGQPKPAAPAPAGDFPLGGGLAPGLRAWQWPPRPPLPRQGDVSTLEPRPSSPSSQPPLADPAAPLRDAGASLAPASCLSPCPRSPLSPALQHRGSRANQGYPCGRQRSQAGLWLSHGGGIPLGRGQGS